jgi:hypothetical protein
LETERAELTIPFAQEDELREKKARARVLISELSLDKTDSVTDFSEDGAREKADAQEPQPREEAR